MSMWGVMPQIKESRVPWPQWPSQSSGLTEFVQTVALQNSGRMERMWFYLNWYISRGVWQILFVSDGFWVPTLPGPSPWVIISTVTDRTDFCSPFPTISSNSAVPFNSENYWQCCRRVSPVLLAQFRRDFIELCFKRPYFQKFRFRLRSSIHSVNFSKFTSLPYQKKNLHPMTVRLNLEREEDGADLKMRGPLQSPDAHPWGSHFGIASFLWGLAACQVVSMCGGWVSPSV